MWLVDDEVVTRWGMLVFITFISYIWHPWLMTKWHGCLIIITMIKKNYKSFDMNINNPTPTPTYLCTYLFSFPPTQALISVPTYYPLTYPPTHPSTYLLPTYPSTHLPTFYPPTYPPTHDPPTHLPTFYFIFPITYPLHTYHPTTCYLPHSLVVIWNKHVK
jgi:hypothetical protein